MIFRCNNNGQHETKLIKDKVLQCQLFTELNPDQTTLIKERTFVCILWTSQKRLMCRCCQSMYGTLYSIHCKYAYRLLHSYWFASYWLLQKQCCFISKSWSSFPSGAAAFLPSVCFNLCQTQNMIIPVVFL